MHFTKITLSKGQLHQVYTHLIESGCLANDTQEQDFYYYFTGEGIEPGVKLVWLQSKTLLAIYVKELTGKSSRPEWRAVDDIFSGISARTLRDLYSKPFSKDTSRSFEKFFEDQRSVQKFLASLSE